MPGAPAYTQFVYQVDLIAGEPPFGLYIHGWGPSDPVLFTISVEDLEGRRSAQGPVVLTHNGYYAHIDGTGAQQVSIVSNSVDLVLVNLFMFRSDW